MAKRWRFIVLVKRHSPKCLILQNHIDFFFFFLLAGIVFRGKHFFLFIFCLTRLSPHPQRWDLKQKHFVVDFFYGAYLLLPHHPQWKNASTILLSIFIKTSLKGRAVSDSFLGHHEQHSSQEVSSTWRRRKEKKKETQTTSEERGTVT